jgi:hypothetical protein
VQRDVPISPTFVVLPFSDYQSQILCAEQAEAALIAAGVKVVMPPPTKYVETKKGIEGEQAKLGQGSDRIQHPKGNEPGGPPVAPIGVGMGGQMETHLEDSTLIECYYRGLPNAIVQRMGSLSF